jgi:hypothetical protein
VSHQPERKHKNCLNCGIMVKGRYCQRCGQENIVTKQTFWSYLTHFVFDIFHFDGKFFDTLKTLFSKPGLVPVEYVGGKRTKYLDPVRMYLFTSAVFFLIFFAIRDMEIVQTSGLEGILSKGRRMDAAMELHARNLKDSLHPMEKKALSALLDSSLVVEFTKDTNLVYDSTIYFKGKPYRLHTQPDSTWYTSPVSDRNWLRRIIDNKINQILRENKDDPEKAFKNMGLKIVHRLPYMLFLSLPFFALILKLVYLRRKQLYYSDHLLFTFYHYIFSFILLLLIMALVEVYKWVELELFLWLAAAGIFYWFYYLYKGMRTFYSQGRFTTIGKLVMINILGFLVFILLVILFALFSFIEI